jgi:hypothetical protein
MGARFDQDALPAKGKAQTGLDDLGDIAHEEALAVLPASLERDAKFDERGIAAAANTVVSMFSKRLALVHDRNENPEIAEEKIEAPVSASTSNARAKEER